MVRAWVLGTFLSVLAKVIFVTHTAGVSRGVLGGEK